MLEEAQFPIDYLAGTSVGAFIGGAYASGLSIDRMIQIALRIGWRDLGRLRLSKLGFRDSATIEQFVRDNFPAQTFEETRIIFAAVAADITTGEAHVMKSGDLAKAIRASCAIPGYFTPVVDDRGRMLVDGGIVANLPTEAVRELGADRVIGVDVYHSIVRQCPPTNAFGVYSQSLSIVVSRSGQAARAAADLLVLPDVADTGWDELDRAAESIKAGERAMLRLLPKCQAWLEVRPSLFRRIFSGSRGRR